MIPMDLKKKAIEYMAPAVKEGSKEFKAFCHYMDDRFEEKGCIVLCRKFEEFENFCLEHKILMNDKELIIDGREVFKSDDYRVRPTMWFHYELKRKTVDSSLF